MSQHPNGDPDVEVETLHLASANQPAAAKHLPFKAAGLEVPDPTLLPPCEVKFRGDHGISFEGTRVSHSVLQAGVSVPCAWNVCVA